MLIEFYQLPFMSGFPSKRCNLSPLCKLWSSAPPAYLEIVFPLTPNRKYSIVYPPESSILSKGLNPLFSNKIKKIKGLSVLKSLKKKRILLVDDSSTIRQVVKNKLVEIGFGSSNIKEAADGNHALASLNDEKFDLIVSDWNMPNMDGLSLLKSVKANDELSSIPFLMVSAERNEKQISEALEQGADQYITKPFRINSLKTTIAYLLIGTTTFADKKVMVVDDSQTMRMVIIKNLIQAGFEKSNIFQAPDGEEAINFLSGEKADIIISDWHMPKIDGLEFLKRIRANEVLKDVPVLMVTAEMQKEKILSAIKAGVNDYIIKPFNAIQLQEKVKKVFSRSLDK